MKSPEAVTVGLAGFGNVGQELARRLSEGAIPEAGLIAVTARNLDRARSATRIFDPTPKVVPLDELARLCDVVIECATADAFPEIARAVVEAGKILIAVSAAGLVNCPELVDLAREHGGRVRVASGALPGLDIIRSAAEGRITSVHLRTRLRPVSMAHEPYVRQRGFDFEQAPPSAPVLIFEGTGAEAARAFPRHFNVAVALSLGGIGLDRTTVEVWVDPDVPGAIHQVEVDADEIGLTMISRNRPSTNPRTSRIVVPSVLAALRALVAPLQVGS
jgi:aspartate dehydrogenase